MDEQDERIDDYLTGRMPEDERAAFEERILEDPALLRELQYAEGLKLGLSELQGERQAPPATDRPIPDRALGHWAPWAPALAATLALAVAVGVILDQRATIQRLAADRQSPAAVPGGQVLLAELSTTRSGASRGPVIVLSDDVDALALRVEDLPAAPGRWRLIRHGEGDVATGELLVASDAGLPQVMIPRTVLAPGDYRLHIETEGRSRDQRFTLRME